MPKLLQSPWILAGLSLLFYIGTTGWLVFQAHLLSPAPVAANEEEVVEVAIGPSWDFTNPDMELLVSELQQTKKNLAQKEAQLSELLTRLRIENEELAHHTQEIHRLQRDFDGKLVRVKEEEKENLTRTLKILSLLSRETAISMISTKPDDEIVKLLGLMKETESAALLEALAKSQPKGPQRAGALLDRLRHFSPGKTNAPMNSK